jgi:hydrogenase maturation factor
MCLGVPGRVISIDFWGMTKPVRDEVRAAGELLGIDPLVVANEGKAVIGVRAGACDRVLDALRAHPLGRHARRGRRVRRRAAGQRDRRSRVRPPPARRGRG